MRTDFPQGTRNDKKCMYIVGGILYVSLVVTMMVLAPTFGKSPIDGMQCSNSFEQSDDDDGDASDDGDEFLDSRIKVALGIILGLLGSIAINTGTTMYRILIISNSCAFTVLQSSLSSRAKKLQGIIFRPKAWRICTT